MLAMNSVAEFDPRNHDNLADVITLCATAPDSWQFDSAWLSWLQANPEADLDAAIATVISRAGTVRSMTIAGLAPRLPASMPSKADLTRHMENLARSATPQPGISGYPEDHAEGEKIRVITSGSSDR